MAFSRQFGNRLAKQLDEPGAVDVLRHGLGDHGIDVRLAFFQPAHGLAPQLTDLYLSNRLTVTRQLPYEAGTAKTIDLCLFVNGIPVATAELKNPLTHQTVEHAKKQYREDRDPANVTLGRRTLVHFAVDPNSVEMRTRLEGLATRFLPIRPYTGDVGGCRRHGSRTAGWRSRGDAGGSGVSETTAPQLAQRSVRISVTIGPASTVPSAGTLRVEMGVVSYLRGRGREGGLCRTVWRPGRS